MSIANTTCLASLPLQFDFRESPGSLIRLPSHYRGLRLNGSTTRQSTWKWASFALFRSDSAQRFFIASSECLRGSGSARGPFAGTIARNHPTDWPSWAAKLHNSSQARPENTIEQLAKQYLGYPALWMYAHMTSKQTKYHQAILAIFSECFVRLPVSIWSRRKDAALLWIKAPKIRSNAPRQGWIQWSNAPPPVHSPSESLKYPLVQRFSKSHKQER